ncbi:arthropod cardioacceleratory peptide 2a [Holotrichia oblita]|uniref:Arthropod cardioacceleratory peptide 2a n=1 Tax=Holotrichia oblita TaxID=644536 RepID=A0ACB9TPS4_HOLOL|nr:arthropod cardioacceleratory peptide 2a [Holotrichia oblita]
MLAGNLVRFTPETLQLVSHAKVLILTYIFANCKLRGASGIRFNRNRLNPRINYHHKSTAYDDTVADPLELNAEPGIEDLSRQILSEVQLHQANIELRKEQEAMDDPELMQGVRNMPNNCAVPPCYIA